MAQASSDESVSTEARSALAPALAGLALALASFSLTVQQGHLAGLSPTFDGTATLVTCVAALAVGAAALHLKRLPKRAIFLITFIAIHVAGIGALGLAFLDATQADAHGLVELALQAASGSGSALLAFFWLRKLRATAATHVSLVVFGAVAAATLLVFFLGIAGPLVRHIATFAFSFAQFATTRASRKTAAPGEALPALPELYFGTSVERFSDRGYLAAALTGVCGMALAGGLAGTLTLSVEGSAGLTVAARIITALTAGAASLLIARYALAERERSLVATIWIALGLMMGTGTVLLALGAGCTYVGGALCAAVLLLLQAHVCYLAVAFASYGERDPYVYAAGAWIALFGFQVLGAALGTLIGAAAPGDRAPVIALIGLCTLAATQLVFTQLLSDPARSGNYVPMGVFRFSQARASADDAGEPDTSTVPEVATTAPVPEAAPAPSPEVYIATSVIAMGQRFGLTGREVEVLTLYALGHTQARVSEELHLSQNTVHTHIKRIYDKTDLHSRQEILDYLNEYGG